MIHNDQVVEIKNNKSRSVSPKWLDTESLKHIHKDSKLIKKYKRSD